MTSNHHLTQHGAPEIASSTIPTGTRLDKVLKFVGHPVALLNDGIGNATVHGRILSPADVPDCIVHLASHDIEIDFGELGKWHVSPLDISLPGERIRWVRSFGTVDGETWEYGSIAFEVQQ